MYSLSEDSDNDCYSSISPDLSGDFSFVLVKFLSERGFFDPALTFDCPKQVDPIVLSMEMKLINKCKIHHNFDNYHNNSSQNIHQKRPI